jgi:hypothetical protein
MAFQPFPAFQSGFQQLGAGVPAAAEGASVVLFPAEALQFRSRWDKTAYAWACFTRDMRAPVAGFRPMTDHYVSAVALAAR